MASSEFSVAVSQGKYMELALEIMKRRRMTPTPTIPFVVSLKDTILEKTSMKVRVLEYRPFRGWNFLSGKAGGSSSLGIHVWKRRCSSNSNVSIPSDSENASEKLTITGITMRLSLPLLHWFQADQDRWAEFQINESKTKGYAIHKSSDDIEEEMEQVPAKRSKFVRGRLTPKKAKILRKNLRETSSRRDIMYHSAIASRLA